MINRKHFYDTVRPSLFKGSMSQLQVQGMEAILNEWDKQALTDVRHLAYILATTYHETAHTMQPIAEYGKGKNYDYGKKLKMGGGPGKRIPYTTPDQIYYGRGHTQNTWFENYQALTKAAKKAGKDWDFLNNPELLLQMEPSIWATFYGMNTGLYTGKKLSDYFNANVSDPLNARRIINGKDKADLIAGYYRLFLIALS